MKKWQIGLLSGLGSAVVAGGIVGGSIAIANSVKQKRAHEADMNTARWISTKSIMDGYRGAERRQPLKKEKLWEIANYALNSLNKVNNVGAIIGLGKVAAVGCDAAGETGDYCDDFVVKTKEYIDYVIKYDYGEVFPDEDVNEYWTGFAVSCQGLIGAQKRAVMFAKPDIYAQLYNDFKTIVAPKLIDLKSVAASEYGKLCAAYFNKVFAENERRETYLDFLNYFYKFFNKPNQLQNSCVAEITQAVFSVFPINPIATVQEEKEIATYWIMKFEGQSDTTVKALSHVGSTYIGCKKQAKDMNKFNSITFDFALPYCYKFNQFNVSEGIAILTDAMIDVSTTPEYADTYIERAKEQLDVILK